MTALAIAVYAVVAIVVLRIMFSHIAYSSQKCVPNRVMGGMKWVNPGHPEWTPPYGLATLAGIGWGACWPLLITGWVVARTRPWRLVTWIRSPAERRYVEEQRKQALAKAISAADSVLDEDVGS